MVARVVWDHEAAGSSPVTSTIGCAADSLKSAALLLFGIPVGMFFGFLCQKALPRFIFLLSFPHKKAIIISNFA